MSGRAERAGLARVGDPAEADVVLLNTCAVRDHAEQRVLGRVTDLTRSSGAGDVLGVVGCMAQRLGGGLLERAPYVDFVAGPDGYRELPQLVRRAREGERGVETAFRPTEHYEDILPATRISRIPALSRGRAKPWRIRKRAPAPMEVQVSMGARQAGRPRWCFSWRQEQRPSENSSCASISAVARS